MKKSTMYDAAPGVPEERTGFRDDSLKEFHERYGITGILPEHDELISDWHRTLGAGCSATDIDFLLIEHRYGDLGAIFEYKKRGTRKKRYELDTQNTNYKALINLCNRARIPLFAVFYGEKRTWFVIAPLGKMAVERYGRDQFELDRGDFVKFSYELRGMRVPQEILDKLTEQ